MTKGQFNEKVILITGASNTNGIGAETARQFAQEGAAVVIITSREGSHEAAKEVTTQIEEFGSKSLWIAGDISDPNIPAEIAKTVKEKFGKLDVLINNAGTKIDKPLNAISYEDWDKVLNTNLRGTYLMIKETISLFPKEIGGSIVNTSSIVGKYGNTGQANYAAAKAGIIGLTKSAAIDLGRRNIRVNSVLPGYVLTELTNNLSEELKKTIIASTPLGRIGEISDIASTIVFLASPKSSFITGQSLIVDGGLDGGIVAISGLMRAGYIKTE